MAQPKFKTFSSLLLDDFADFPEEEELPHPPSTLTAITVAIISATTCFFLICFILPILVLLHKLHLPFIDVDKNLLLFTLFSVFKRKKTGYQSIRLLKILNLIIDNVKNNLLFNINSRVLFHLYNLSFSSSARTFVKEVSRFPDLSIHIKSAFPK